jgi:SP family myo-inositol transporter-like MFS transporter 13
MADSTAQQPLMSQHDDDVSSEVDLNDVDLLLEKNLRKPSFFVWLLTLSAGISGLLFGCESLHIGSPI